MADRISKEQRSKNMALVKSRGNKSTEQKLLSHFRARGITGWRRHYKKLAGTPDFVFPKKRVAVFIDGCFWHGCKKCYTAPKSNKEFWERKVFGNKERDRRNNALVKKAGWKVVRIWEHDLKKAPNIAVSRLIRSLGE